MSGDLDPNSASCGTRTAQRETFAVEHCVGTSAEHHRRKGCGEAQLASVLSSTVSIKPGELLFQVGEVGTLVRRWGRSLWRRISISRAAASTWRTT